MRSASTGGRIVASQQVVIRLVGENDQLRKSLQDSQKQMKRLEKQVAGIKRSGKGAFKPMAQGMGVAAGATVAAAKAFDFLKGSVKTTEELTKASAKLSNITGQDVATSAQWVQLAKARGMGAQKLQVGFTTLSKQITAAANGSGKAAKALGDLGVSQQAIESGDTNTVLMQLSDGLARVQNPAERAALAQQLLGRSGKDLLGVLKGGSGALQEQLDIYKGSSRDIAANKDQVLGLAANQRELTQAVDSVKISLGVALIPVMKTASDILKRFANLSPGVKKLIMTLIAMAATGALIAKLVGVFKAVRVALIAMKVAMMTNPFTALAVAVLAISFLVYRHWGAIKKFLMATWNWIKGAVKSLADRVVHWAKKGFLGPIPWIITNWNRIVGFLKGLRSKIATAAKNIASALWGGIKRGASGVVGFIKGIVNSYIGVLETAINTILGGINRIIRAYNRVPLTPDIATLGRVNLPRLAEGGIVRRPTVALIGEAGPEAVVPLRGKNARAAGAAMGAGNNYFTINTTGPVDEQALARSIGWQLATRGLA